MSLNTQPKVFTYQDTNGQLKEISIEQIQNMLMVDFLNFNGRLMNVRRRKRKDIAIFENNVKVLPSHEKEIFRKGITQEDTYATSNTEYVKTEAHTNMNRGGHFGEGNMTIVTAIECIFNATAMVGTLTNGIVTNPKGTAPSNYDPALFHTAVCENFKIELWRGETKVTEGLLNEFPQLTGASGFAGASVGALVQNAFLPNNFLNNPIVFVDDEDFYIKVKPLAPEFDLTSATGLNLPVIIKVKLSTIELIRAY